MENRAVWTKQNKIHDDEWQREYNSKIKKKKPKNKSYRKRKKEWKKNLSKKVYKL